MDDQKDKKRTAHPLVRQAWERFALYDYNAGRFQKKFGHMQSGILLLAVLATLFALSQTQLQLVGWLDEGSIYDHLLRVFIILIPISVSVLISASNRFKAGNKWIYLRVAAEEIKQELYRYRTRTGLYSKAQTRKINADSKLANRLKNITRRLMGTEVNLAGLQPPSDKQIPPTFATAKGDDGFGKLSSQQYLEFRLKDQLAYYSSKTRKLDKELKRYQWGIYIFGGIGTFLAAIGLELWIALTTALAGAFTTFLQFKQTENLLVAYNRAAGDLENVLTWWLSLSPAEKRIEQNFDRLVQLTENVLGSENSGWIQQMQDMLDELSESQAEKQGPETEA